MLVNFLLALVVYYAIILKMFYRAGKLNSKIHNAFGFTLAELIVVTGLLSGLTVVIATFVDSTVAINRRTELASTGLESLSAAQLALTALFSQAINVRVVTSANLSPAGGAPSHLNFRNITNTNNYYSNITSRVLDDGTNAFISASLGFNATTVNDYSNAAVAANTTLVGLVFFEDQNSYSTLASAAMSSVQAAAIYFQRPTNYTSGVLYIVRTLDTMPDAPGNIDLEPCTACPANVTTQKFDGLVNFDFMDFIHSSGNTSNLDGGSAPMTGIKIRLVTRSFLNNDQSGWLWCEKGAHMANCAALIGPHQDYDRIFTVGLRNNIQFTGKADTTTGHDAPPSGGNDDYPVEERTFGPIYFFKPKGGT